MARRRRFEHLRSTVAREDTCACGAPVWAAWDDGLFVRAEAVAINPEAEFDVLLTGRTTYTRRAHGFGLARRDVNEIDAGLLPGETIHIEHRHGR